MNRITRLLAVVSMGAAAAVALTGPAQAAAGDTSHRAPAQVSAHWGDDDQVFVGSFADPFTCNRVGRLGEISDRWDDYRCIPLRGGLRDRYFDGFRGGFDGFRSRFDGFRRANWVLVVDEDDWNGGYRPWCFSGYGFGNDYFGYPGYEGGFFPYFR